MEFFDTNQLLDINLLSNELNVQYDCTRQYIVNEKHCTDNYTTKAQFDFKTFISNIQQCKNANFYKYISKQLQFFSYNSLYQHKTNENNHYNNDIFPTKVETSKIQLNQSILKKYKQYTRIIGYNYLSSDDLKNTDILNHIVVTENTKTFFIQHDLLLAAENNTNKQCWISYLTYNDTTAKQCKFKFIPSITRINFFTDNYFFNDSINDIIITLSFVNLTLPQINLITANNWSYLYSTLLNQYLFDGINEYRTNKLIIDIANNGLQTPLICFLDNNNLYTFETSKLFAIKYLKLEKIPVIIVTLNTDFNITKFKFFKPINIDIAQLNTMLNNKILLIDKNDTKQL